MSNNVLIKDLPAELLLKIIQKTKFENFNKMFETTKIINSNLQSCQSQIIKLEKDIHNMHSKLHAIENYCQTILPFYNLLSIYCFLKILYPFGKFIFYSIIKTKKHILEILKYLLLLVPSIIYNLTFMDIISQQINLPLIFIYFKYFIKEAIL